MKNNKNTLCVADGEETPRDFSRRFTKDLEGGKNFGSDNEEIVRQKWKVRQSFPTCVTPPWKTTKKGKEEEEEEEEEMEYTENWCNLVSLP
ncbi:hypothetical protein RUM43_005624 [Polyplax serrata]|uniref:Uncharacterized protein n=1 Tax=Polyplax serrata TaxID=468196 RepID=A0AAN8NWD1_POLSC